MTTDELNAAKNERGLVMVNIGDTVYDTFADMVEALEVAEIKQTFKGTMICAVGAMSENEFPLSEIGVSIFPTQKEAAEFIRGNGGRPKIIFQENAF